MASDNITGPLALAMLVGGWFIYSEVTRTTSLPSRFIVTYADDSPFKNAEPYVNQLLVFYGNHGVPPEAGYAVYMSFLKPLYELEKIDEGALRRYFVCSIQPNVGRKLIAEKEALHKIGFLYSQAKNNAAALKAFGKYESTLEEAGSRLEPYTSAFRDCWKSAQSARSKIKLPFPVAIP